MGRGGGGAAHHCRWPLPAHWAPPAAAMPEAAVRPPTPPDAAMVGFVVAAAATAVVEVAVAEVAAAVAPLFEGGISVEGGRWSRRCQPVGGRGGQHHHHRPPLPLSLHGAAFDRLIPQPVV
jgi:hypothetical protein